MSAINLSIEDPQKAAQYAADLQAGRVPQWDPTNRTRAEAWSTYFNELLGDGTVTLEEKTTYKIVINSPENR